MQFWRLAERYVIYIYDIIRLKVNWCFKMKFIFLLITKELTPFSHRVYLQLMVIRPHQKQRCCTYVTSKLLKKQRLN